ncbi:MAG: hypothetical protein ACFE8V_14240 [Promethearchaeota archaeon]
MKKNKERIKIKGIANNLIRTCPVCGFSFRIFDPKTRKKITVCPMCGHKFIEPDLFSDKRDELKRDFF